MRVPVGRCRARWGRSAVLRVGCAQQRVAVARAAHDHGAGHDGAADHNLRGAPNERCVFAVVH